MYLGLVITLFSSAELRAGGASRQQLIETLGVSAQTLHRWRYWWQVTLPASGVWKSLRSRFMPPLLASALPAALLMAMNGSDLAQRLVHAMVLLLPLSSASCARSIRLNLEPQKM